MEKKGLEVVWVLELGFPHYGETGVPAAHGGPGDAEIHLQPMEEIHIKAGGCLRGGCEPIRGARREGPWLEQPVLEGLHPREKRHCSSLGRAAACGMDSYWRSWQRDAAHGWTHTREVPGELSPR
ncbi:hypothetical protein TURU_147171 [Turdus rufiventris]|nr:hypothetical protein TURU_147171 [Turdus rufiventris]